MAKITGVGHYVPEKIVFNHEVSFDSAWVELNTGIKQRRIIGEGQTTASMAVVAGMKAVESARLKDIDVVIVATATPDMIAPSTACIVKNRLNLSGAAFDINAVCSGFLYGMILGHSLINSGAKNVLIIGADIFSILTDWDRRDCVFFGDGAGAVVLSSGEGVKSMFMGADLSENTFTCEHGKKFVMNSKGVYNAALRLIPEAINIVIQCAGMTIDEIDYMVPHQPSIRILNDVADKIGLPRSKVLMNMDRYANTSAGTIPILLSESWIRFRPGDKILFAAIGAGWTYGAIIYEV